MGIIEVVYMAFKAELLREILQEIRYQYDENLSNEHMRDLLLGEYKEHIPHSTWGTWIGDEIKKIKTIRKDTQLKHALEKSLQLPERIWTMDDEEQKKLLRKNIAQFVSRLKGNQAEYRLNDLFPNFEDLSDEYKSVLIKMQSMDEFEIKSLVKESIESNKIFFKTSENQPILLKLAEFFYIRGMYDILIDDVFQNMFEPSLNRIEMRLMRAHSLGFHSDTSRAIEAAEILKDLAQKTSLNEDRIDYLTSAISNMRRSLLLHDHSEDDFKRILKLLINHYDQFKEEKNGTHNRYYYPAINLAYLVVLAQSHFPNCVGFTHYDISCIYHSASESIELEKEKDNESLQYYAMISDLEFKMLLNTTTDVVKVLQNLKPSVAMVKRTKRQVEFFRDTLTQNHYLSAVSWDFLKGLNDYIAFREKELRELFGYIKDAKEIDDLLKKLSNLIDLLNEDTRFMRENKLWLKEILATAKNIASNGIQLTKIAEILHRLNAHPNEIKTLLLMAFDKEVNSDNSKNAIKIAQIYFNLLRNNTLLKKAYEHESQPLKRCLLALRYKIADGSGKLSLDWFISDIVGIERIQQLKKLSFCFIKIFASSHQNSLQKIQTAIDRADIFHALIRSFDSIILDQKQKKKYTHKLLEQVGK